jgi:septum formation protein
MGRHDRLFLKLNQQSIDLKPVSIILASGSRYRAELLARLRVPFAAWAPDLDESGLAGETPAQAARRLALAKARAGAAFHPGAIVIGSDQVADLNGRALGKPGTREVAEEQLRAMRGQTVIFHTALALARAEGGEPMVEMVETDVRFRALSDQEIERYLALEPAFDCAGSAKAEALGIALTESIRSDDPTALIGLPLIALARMLRAVGVPVP